MNRQDKEENSFILHEYIHHFTFIVVFLLIDQEGKHKKE